MANKFQLKRTSTSGLLPNTTNSGNTSYIAAGELAINLTDKKMVSSNGTVTFEIGANLSSLNISGVITANGSDGTAGYVLKSGGTGANAYWAVASGSGTPGGSNTHVQFNDSGAFGGVAGFTFNKTTETVNASNLNITNTATINTNSMTVGNSTVNTVVTNTYLRVASNSTVYANLTTTSLNIGANLVANTTEVTAGNTTLHSSLTHGYVHVINSTSTANLSPTTLTIGSNVTLSTSTLLIGNSTVNNNMTSTLIKVSDASSTANLTSTSLTVGANVTVNTSTMFVGNSTVNTSITSSQASIANSTGNTVIVPGAITVNSISVGYRDIPITIQNATYGFVLTDAGRGIGKDNATAYVYTIPANGTTAFPIGTAITVFNGNATSNITIAITTDTLRLAGTTTTGSRTIAPWGLCTLYKIASTVWLASGPGVT